MNPKGTQRPRNYVIRPDGKPINVPRQRGQLFICENGCCCGHTDRGFAPVPHDLYYNEWTRRKLRNRVHLNHAGCLGPCALANVALLIFDGRPIWFHSLNDERLILAVFDYIDAMLDADGYLPPPPVLTPHAFNGFAWTGEAAAAPAAPAWEDAEQTAALVSGLKSGILLLTHKDTDLLTLDRALQGMPQDFPPVRGVNLLSLPTADHVDAFIRRELQDVQVLILRPCGGRRGFQHGFDPIVRAAERLQIDLICVPGTDELDPELTAYSSVPVPVVHDVDRYLQFGGVDNMRQLLCFLADHLLAGGWGYEQPQEMPQHGVYHPGGSPTPAQPDPARPVVGILFYRSHFLSGNLAFVDALIQAVEAAGGRALPVFTASLKSTTLKTTTLKTMADDGARPAAFDFFYDEAGQRQIDCLICTISFAMGGINNEGVTQAGWNVDALQALGVPVLQAVASGMREDEWRLNARGLRPLDVAMNVALPEFDGRIITTAVSFKGEDADPACGCEACANGSTVAGDALVRYVPIPDRARVVARQAMRLAALQRKPNREKRVAFVLTNSSDKADRIGNAVGLDAPASLMRLFAAMQAAGYAIDNPYEDGDSLIHALIDRCSYDETLLTEAQLANAAGRVPVERYADWFGALTPSQQEKMRTRWQEPPGEAYVHVDAHGHNQHIALAGLELGNVFVALQPPRGYGMDPDAIYHTPDLPPTHHYYALYKWLAQPQSAGGWGADAIVHMGKHGTLEWLPGKSVGLSADCFPDAFLDDLPLVYPFIINNPGEGSQAKRRAHAVIVDHMIPPMTSADVYGELAQLTQLVDEYYQVEQMDPSKLPLIQQQIWELMQQTQLDKDVAEMMRFIDHGDHTHEWDGSYTDDGTPLTLAEMQGTDFQHLLEDIDGYLCELGSLQIRDGLHTLGHVPEGDQLCHLLRALTRLPNDHVPSLRAGVAALLGYALDDLLDRRGQKLTQPPDPGLAARFDPPRALHTYADMLQLVDDISLDLLTGLQAAAFAADQIDAVIDQRLGQLAHAAARRDVHRVLTFVCTTLVPLIRQTDGEIDHVLAALDGQYIPAGPAGAPTRGMAHILPTGRNFYAVDPRAVPSRAAWRIGQDLARELLDRYQQEEQGYPECVGLTVWGTSAMRTHGDDIAQCFALLGVRPVWQAESRRITDIEVIPLDELGRPRIDVLVRISGFFRDAFPHLIDLLDRAVRRVAELDEPSERNFVRKHYLADLAKQIASGQDDAQAAHRASLRVFGSKPGSYGAGILPLIHAQNWESDADFAQAYINWGGYAYGEGVYGEDAREEFSRVLSGVQVAVKNQDNREHDIFDSDDYLQYHGGMIATIRALNGRNPKSYFGDNSNPGRAEVRTLQQEAYRVFRSRVVNPKWIEGIKRHGYKGALELSATVEYLFGYDATANVVDDWMYEQTAARYALDPQMQEFFRQSNPWALQSIAERLLEAAQRGLWDAPAETTLDQLRAVYRQVDAELEGR